MRRIRLLVEYDGTDYRGFQRQPRHPSVQADLESRLTKICGHPVEVVGAGRTDAGVHALGQVVHFDTDGRIPTERIAQAANSLPGGDLLVRRADEVEPEFHARFSAVRRSYEYYFSIEKPPVVLGRYVAHEPHVRPGVERMASALSVLLGAHDFASFCGESDAGSTVRTVFQADLEERNGLVRLRLAANGFLKSMVRIIAGTLLQVGCGVREPQELGQVLEARDRSMAGPPAKPLGLFLTRVDYPDGFPEGAGLSRVPFWD